jgi:putative ABC transport system permease protein
VVIGIAAIVALLSISQGLQNTITAQLQKGFATDTIIVAPGGGGVFGGANFGFTLLVNDTETIDGIENVSTSVAIIQKTGYAKLGDRVAIVSIVGVDIAKYSEIYSSTFVAESGQITPVLENETIIVGKRVVDPWLNGTVFASVNDPVDVIWPNATARPQRNETLSGHITAVLNEIGGFGMGGPSDYAVYIPISRAESFFGTDECNTIIVKLTKDDDVTVRSVSKAIREAFNNEVSAISATAVLSILSTVFSTLELFLGGIAAISLLVAGIGIMNIMIVSLMERTREIGILKALGMKSRTVLLVFLSESVIIGLIGAVIGIASGWALANIVALIFSGGGRATIGFGNQAATTTGTMAITPVLTPTVTILALAFGVGVSIIFAIYPAWRASKLKPVEALRYE